MPLYRPTVAPAQWFPSDHGLTSWAYEPQGALNTSAVTNGTLFLIGLQIRAATTISALWVNVATVAVTPTAGQSGLALYSSAGTLLSSAMSDTIFTTTGPRSGTLAVAQSVLPGMYWQGILGQAATPATLSRSNGSITGSNAGLATAALRFCVNGTGLTAFPGSITPASNSATGAVTFWSAAA